MKKRVYVCLFVLLVIAGAIAYAKRPMSCCKRHHSTTQQASLSTIGYSPSAHAEHMKNHPNDKHTHGTSVSPPNPYDDPDPGCGCSFWTKLLECGFGM